MKRIPDEALVIRGGLNRPESIEKGIALHPKSGVTGISVECALVDSVEELAVAAALPHSQLGCTTVKKIRQAGGDVIRTPGRNPSHATLVGLSCEAISALLTPTFPNPWRRPK